MVFSVLLALLVESQGHLWIKKRYFLSSSLHLIFSLFTSSRAFFFSGLITSLFWLKFHNDLIGRRPKYYKFSFVSWNLFLSYFSFSCFFSVFLQSWGCTDEIGDFLKILFIRAQSYCLLLICFRLTKLKNSSVNTHYLKQQGQFNKVSKRFVLQLNGSPGMLNRWKSGLVVIRIRVLCAA